MEWDWTLTGQGREEGEARQIDQYKDANYFYRVYEQDVYNWRTYNVIETTYDYNPNDPYWEEWILMGKFGRVTDNSDHTFEEFSIEGFEVQITPEEMALINKGIIDSYGPPPGERRMLYSINQGFLNGENISQDVIIYGGNGQQTKYSIYEREINEVIGKPQIINQVNAEDDYWKRSLDQVIKGNYSQDVTLAGTVGQVGLGLTGVDIVADARDLVYDFTHWEWSLAHVGQTALDTVGVLPLVGALKNVDEVVTLAKHSDILGDTKHLDEIAEGTRNGATFEGKLYRSVGEGHDPLLIHEGNINANHRYTEPGTGGLYFSTGEKIVKAELNTWNVPSSGRAMHSFDVKIDNLLDVSNPNVRNQLGINLKDITGDSYEVTHKIGQYAQKNGYSGIVAPSARADGGLNVIIFDGAIIIP